MYQIGITFFRVLICLIIIKNMCFYLPMADQLFGANSIFPFASYADLMRYYGLGAFTYPFNLPLLPQLYLILVIIFATLYMVAVGGRFMGFLLYLSIIFLKIRNGFILDGSDNVIQVTLPFLIIGDNLKYFRLFDNYKETTLSLNAISHLGIYALMIQVSFVYFFTALAKLQGELWLNGTAVYYTMRVRDFMATDWNIPLTENHYFVVLGTYFTLLWEMAFPFLIWFRQTRFYIIVGGVILHLGIWIFMRIDNFSWVMMTSYLVFIKDDEYMAISNWIKSKTLVVFIDGWCTHCLRFGAFIKTLDLLNIIDIRDIRNKASEKESGLDMDRAIRAIASKNIYEKNYYGFNTLLQIAIRVPLLWILVPVFLLAKIIGIGDFIYNELAIKRKIIPVHCPDRCAVNELSQNQIN